jgi:hypothetical protein
LDVLGVACKSADGGADAQEDATAAQEGDIQAPP